MARSSSKLDGRRSTQQRRSQARGLVASEVELIMRERERLLQAAGAAAALVARLDPRALPREAIAQIRRLGARLDALSDETLSDAIRSLHAMQGAPGRLSAHT